jgi:hypothetical protein
MGLHSWEDELVWDQLGGRDNLVLMIGASGFGSHVSVTNNFRRRVAMVNYRDVGGKLRRLTVAEWVKDFIDWNGYNDELVTVDVQPAPWTPEWLLWIVRGDG